MSTKKKIVISMIAILILILGGVMVVHANGDTLSSEDLLSSGRIEIDLDNDNNVDAIFDAKDLKDIATSVENGKSSLATAINAYPNTNVAQLASFSELASAINNLTAVPDIYYYDKATEGDSCVRYMYADGSYYPCNEYGEKTSNTALSGTITIVTKDDTTKPSAGETQLVKYEQTQAANLSAGSAGYVDNSFILGSGSDNISYRNQGYEDGFDEGSKLTKQNLGSKAVSFVSSNNQTLSQNVTFSCTSIANWKTFTINNFSAEYSMEGIGSSNSANHVQVQKPVLSYNNSTGVLTVTISAFTQSNSSIPQVAVYAYCYY